MTSVRTFTSSALPAYDRGFELGERHAGDVARTVADYARLFRARRAQCSDEPFDVDLWSERAWAVIGTLAPQAAQEIRGIADGSGVDVRRIAGINARTELLAIANPTGTDECSTVVSLAPGRPPVAVQTWDWYAAMAGNWFHWTIPHPDGRVVQTVTEYGILGKIGVNTSGVGVMFNMLHHAHDLTGGEPADGEATGSHPIGYPLHLLARRVLDDARSVADAVDLIGSVRTSASSSLTVVDEGTAVSAELFPGGLGLVRPDEDGLLVRTNHFVSAEGRDGCLATDIGPGSRIRIDTLRSALSGRASDRAIDGLDDVVATMLDHRDVGGVCAHPDAAYQPVLQHATLATVGLDVAGHGLDVRPGGPCGAEVRVLAAS
jgi:isopenicillin-N N-acyltransferase-like protein